MKVSATKWTSFHLIFVSFPYNDRGNIFNEAYTYFPSTSLKFHSNFQIIYESQYQAFYVLLRKNELAFILDKICKYTTILQLVFNKMHALIPCICNYYASSLAAPLHLSNLLLHAYKLLLMLQFFVGCVHSIIKYKPLFTYRDIAFLCDFYPLT